MSYDELCRLCASYNAVKVDIFSLDGRDRQLVDKIQACLQFKVRFLLALCSHSVRSSRRLGYFSRLSRSRFYYFLFRFRVRRVFTRYDPPLVSFSPPLFLGLCVSLSSLSLPPPSPLSVSLLLSRIQFRAFTPLNNLPCTRWPITRLVLDFILPKNEMEHCEREKESEIDG